MSGIKAQKWRFALKQAILLLYILLSSNNCASLSLMTDIKRGNEDLNSVREELKNVNVNIMRQLINQETLIRVSISKTVNDMMNDFVAMKKSLAETQTELRDIKEDNYRLKEQVSQIKTQLGEYNTTLQQTRNRQDTLITEVNTDTEKLKVMGAENKVLKERSSEYMKQISNLTVTVEQIQKGHAKLLKDSNNLTRELKDLNDENKILKNQSLEYEKDIAEMNFTFEQIHEKQVDLTKKSNIHEKEINDLSKDKIILQKENLKTEEQISNLNMTVQQLQQEQIILKSETTSHSGKIKDINDSSKALEKRISENEKALADVNLKIFGMFFKDCADIKTQNILKRIYPDGVYTIYPSKKIGAVEVYCDMTTEGGGWTVIQRRFDGSTEFFRNWTDYKHGFGDPKKEYWLGNDIIHVLTANAKQELRIDLQKFSGAKAYAKYSQFAIGDENAKYKLSISGYNGTAGDSLAYHNGMNFSTRDRDNDNDSRRNCAVSYTGAWWYKNCHRSNLNGHYYTTDGAHGYKGLHWYYFRNSANSMKSTKLMIRPKLSQS